MPEKVPRITLFHEFEDAERIRCLQPGECVQPHIFRTCPIFIRWSPSSEIVDFHSIFHNQHEVPPKVPAITVLHRFLSEESTRSHQTGSCARPENFSTSPIFVRTSPNSKIDDFVPFLGFFFHHSSRAMQISPWFHFKVSLPTLLSKHYSCIL